MVADPTQQQPVKGLTKLALLRGMRDGLTVAVIGLLAGNFWALHVGNGSWHAHIDVFMPLWGVVFGLQVILTAEVQVLRKRLQPLQKTSPSTTTGNSPAGMTTLGLFWIGSGAYFLLNKMFDFSFSDTWFPFIMIFVWLAAARFFPGASIAGETAGRCSLKHT